MLDLTYETPAPKVIAGAKHDWELVIGMEVHAQVASNAKLFSGSSTAFGAEPNSNVAFVDAAMPGMLPVINEFCVEQAVRTGLGLKAEINLWSAFDRKNYFYADLPKGYQITQDRLPICIGGKMPIYLDGAYKEIRIHHIHMEEDAGKLVHAGSDSLAGSTYSLVDYNRAGVPLIEIVSEPDLRTGKEAAEYAQEVRRVVRYLGVGDGNMQEGSLRCDVNISIRPKGREAFGTKVEIKNMNSFSAIQKAIDYEIERQTEAIESGDEEIVQETRLWDESTQVTKSMRSKEGSSDYRYFPEPDLPPPSKFLKSSSKPGRLSYLNYPLISAVAMKRS